MIYRMPRFDEGLNPNIGPYIINTDVGIPDGYTSDAVYNEMSRSGIYDPTLTNIIDPRVQAMADAITNPQPASTGIRPSSARHSSTTTALQDRKTATELYNKAMKAADIKARLEVSTAHKQQAAANKVLKRNGQPQYKEVRPNGSNVLPPVVVTGKRKQTAILNNKLTKETGKYGDVYSEYANMQVGAVGKAKRNPSKVVFPQRLAGGAPGQTSDAGTKSYWARRKALIAAVNKNKSKQTAAKIRSAMKRGGSQAAANEIFWGGLKRFFGF